MSKAQEAIARARRTANEAKADATEMISGVVTSYMIGSLEKSGNMNSIPKIFGLPRTVTLAAAAKLLAYNSSGNTRQIANGVGSAATHVAVYQFSKGADVSGDERDLETSGRAIHDRGRRLEAIGRASANDEIEALERSARASSAA